MKTSFLFSGILYLSTLSLFSQDVSTLLNTSTAKVDDALLLGPQGIIYGSHYNGSNVYKIDAAGNAQVFATGFNTPNGLAMDSQHQIYVADPDGAAIYKLAETGAFLDTIKLNSPSGIIKSHHSDTMIFTQWKINGLFKLAPDGTVIPFLSGAPLNGPVGLAQDENGVLYIGNFNDRKIFRVVGNSLQYVATVPGPTNGWLGFITYAQKCIWGTSFNAHKIYRIHPNYTDSVSLLGGSVAGEVDGPISQAKFNTPNGIVASVTGDSLYVSDYGSGRIRVIRQLHLTKVEEKIATSLDIHLFPNPFQDKLTISTSATIQQIEIFSMNGALLYTGALSTDHTLSVSHLPSGMYVLKLITTEGVHAEKIMKTS